MNGTQKAPASERNGHSKPEVDNTELPLYERIAKMRSEGWEQTFSTGRKVRIRTLEPDMLLKDDDCPDILTPLLLKSLYSTDRDSEVREFIEQPFGSKEDAYAFVDLINLICRKTIVDGTRVEELTLAEKKLIFRFALGSSEVLVSFLYKPPPAMAVVAQGDDLPQAAE